MKKYLLIVQSSIQFGKSEKCCLVSSKASEKLAAEGNNRQENSLTLENRFERLRKCKERNVEIVFTIKVSK